MSTLIRAIHSMQDAGPVVRCAPDVDLDLLVLEAAMRDEGAYWFPASDEPTQVAANTAEALVGWFRINPCPRQCGEHGWHLEELGDERPTTARGRGAWFGVWFQ